jgi:RNA polymerase sigma factor (sigma-70 family)
MSYLSSDMQKFINSNLLTETTLKKLVTFEEFKELKHNPLLIIQRYIALIILMSNKYASNPMVEKDDLVMEGIVGLLDAIERFDEKRGKKFHTLATIRIKGEMYNYFLSNKMPVSVPRYIAIVLSHAESMRSLLLSCLSNRSEVNDIMLKEETPKHPNVPPSIQKKVIRLKEKITNIAMKQVNCGYEEIMEKAQGEFLFVSLEETASANLATRIIINPEESYNNKQIIEKLKALASDMYKNPKALGIINLYLAGHDNATISRNINVSRGYVSYITNDFTKKIRKTGLYSEIKLGGLI